MRLFALHSSQAFGEKVAAELNRPLDQHEERSFDDGEHKIRPLVNVRDEDVYVVQSLYANKQESVNDKLCKLLFFIATLKDVGAKRVTAVVPYLCYARKDRRTKARDPVTTRYVASLFEAVHTDCVVTVDVHNLQAFQNAFRCRTEHLEAQKIFISHFQRTFKSNQRVVVMSPDIGGVKRAEQFRERLSKSLSMEVDFAFMEKQRSEGVLSGEKVVGDVKGKMVIILDDLINSGMTLSRAASACGQLGASRVYAVATHGVFNERANMAFQEKTLEKVIVTNTVSVVGLNAEAREKLEILDAAPMMGEVIRRLNTGGSIVSLMELE